MRKRKYRKKEKAEENLTLEKTKVYFGGRRPYFKKN